MPKIKINSKVIETKSINTSVLEIVESAGIKLRYQCRDGYCGSCRCKLKSGQIKYMQEPLAYVDDDEILVCIASCLTDIAIIPDNIQ